MAAPPRVKVSTWITALSLIVLAVLAMFDLTQEEAVPTVVYGIIGGIALGADGEFLPSILGKRGKDE